MARYITNFLLLCIIVLLWTNVLIGQEGAASYFTPEEYEVIVSAVEQYNLDHPNRKIKELNRESLKRLINAGYLSGPADSEEDRLPLKTQSEPGATSEEKRSITRLSRESFEGTIEKSSKLLSEQSPKSKGNPSTNQSLEIDKKTISIKVNDQYKNVTIFAPRVPEAYSKRINGKTRRARKTILQEQIKRKFLIRPKGSIFKPIKQVEPVPASQKQIERPTEVPSKTDESDSSSNL